MKSALFWRREEMVSGLSFVCFALFRNMQSHSSATSSDSHTKENTETPRRVRANTVFYVTTETRAHPGHFGKEPLQRKGSESIIIRFTSKEYDARLSIRLSVAYRWYGVKGSHKQTMHRLYVTLFYASIFASFGSLRYIKRLFSLASRFSTHHIHSRRCNSHGGKMKMKQWEG